MEQLQQRAAVGVFTSLLPLQSDNGEDCGDQNDILQKVNFKTSNIGNS